MWPAFFAVVVVVFVSALLSLVRYFAPLRLRRLLTPRSGISSCSRTPLDGEAPVRAPLSEVVPYYDNAASGQPQSAQLPSLPNIPKHMSTFFWCSYGALRLSPLTTRDAINYACLSKSDTDNYRVYVGKIRGKVITDEEWEKWCNFCGKQLGTATNLDELDMTALNCLFHVLLRVRKETEVTLEKGALPLTYVHDRPVEASVQTDDIPGLQSVSDAAKKKRPCQTAEERSTTARSISAAGQAPVQIIVKNHKTVRNASVQAQDITWAVYKVKNVKNITDKIVHDEKFARDPASFGKVVSVLKEVIDESSETYCLSLKQAKELNNKLDSEISQMSNADKAAPSYICAALLTSGRQETKDLWTQRLSHEQLMFDSDKVKRQSVFHALEVMLRKEGNNEVLPYTKLLEAAEQFIVVSGTAGSGKTTLLKNITLQFSELHQARPEYLKDSSLLVYIDCKDRTATLDEVIEKQFKDLCTQFGSKSVLTALRSLDVLFLVDAFDEANLNSTEVLNELIKETLRSKSRILFTSRPETAKSLGQMLSRHDACFSEYEILPLTELKDQLDFLKRHGDYLGDAKQSEAMQQCFSDLNDQAREMFTEPINLVLFCHLFRHRPDRIPHLQHPAQVTQEIFVLYQILIERKLCDSDFHNSSVIIDDQFLIVGKLALQSLARGVLTFNQDEFLTLQRLCSKKLKNEEAPRRVTPHVFLSVILKLHRPLTGTEPVFWTFHHKTLQQRFAARYVVNAITDTSEPLTQILGVTAATGSMREWRSFLEVLQYVVQDLSADLFEQRWSQLKEALQEAGADFSTWRDMVLVCSGDANEDKKVAEVAKMAARDDWTVRSGRDVVAVARMLPHAQPSRLRVESLPQELRGASWEVAPPREEVTSPWEEVVRLWKGELSLELPLDTPCDDLLTPLLDTRAQLEWFWGGVAEAASAAALSSAATPASRLTVHLLAPLSLSALRGRCSSLKVEARPFAVADGGPWPLPAQPRPRLQVTDVQPGAWRDVVHTVQSLAPEDNRYEAIVLSRCHMSEGDVDRTVAALQRRGIRTEGSGGVPTRWTRTDIFSRPKFRLLITDELPERLTQLE